MLKWSSGSGGNECYRAEVSSASPIANHLAWPAAKVWKESSRSMRGACLRLFCRLRSNRRVVGRFSAWKCYSRWLGKSMNVLRQACWNIQPSNFRLRLQSLSFERLGQTKVPVLVCNHRQTGVQALAADGNFGVISFLLQAEADPTLARIGILYTTVSAGSFGLRYEWVFQISINESHMPEVERSSDILVWRVWDTRGNQK